MNYLTHVTHTYRVFPGNRGWEALAPTPISRDVLFRLRNINYLLLGDYLILVSPINTSRIPGMAMA